MLEKFKNEILAGKVISPEQALLIAEHPSKELLYDYAAEITIKMSPRKFDLCSIINAKSGQCSENCKWCSQSVHHQTTVEKYNLLSSDECVQRAVHNEKQAVKRFSLVTSGRKLNQKELQNICNIYKVLSKETNMSLCASLGLLEGDEMKKLREAGVDRYHCNLETAPSYFPSLCTTHTIEDKIKTLQCARENGMEVCSGGIIGMGETMKQRIELAFSLKSLGVSSIPLNILQPISGTPLGNTPLLSDEEILSTIAIFRWIHPQAYLRFSGGRNQLSKEMQAKALSIGINSAIVGDMLTTIGSKIFEDKILIKNAGYELG